jgi:hypothetical protein
MFFSSSSLRARTHHNRPASSNGPEQAAMAKSTMQQDVHEQLKKLPRTELNQLATFAVEQSTHTVMKIRGMGARGGGGGGTRPPKPTKNINNTGKRFYQWRRAVSRINPSSWSIATLLLIPKEELRSCQDPPLNHSYNPADSGNLSRRNLASQLAVLVVDTSVWVQRRVHSIDLVGGQAASREQV